MKRTIFALVGLVAMLMATTALADGGKIDKAAITAAVQQAFPRYQVTHIEATPMPGIALVELNGSQTVYTSGNGRYLFTGDLIQLGDKGPVDLSEKRMQDRRARAFAGIAPDNMVTYPADGKQKAVIYAFTDTTCPYCRKMHSHMADYNKEGITVHYLAFPRAGPASQAAADMRHIWCASDPAKAFTEANLHDRISNARLGDCAKAVNRQYELGVRLGVRGTPAVYNAQGVELGGYLTPEQMKQRLGR